MKSSGATMASGSFMTTTATDGSATLADLTVSGYTAPTWNNDDGEWVDGCAGDFVVQFLSQYGTVEAKYAWFDNGEQTKGWYNADGSEIDGGATSVKIEAGKALWIQGRGMKLTSAGAVNVNDIAFVTRGSGASAVGNTTPIDLTLGKLTVSGYTTPTWNNEDGEWVDGCAGDFVVQFLTYQGTVAAKYAWFDNGEQTKGWYNADGTEISGGASSVSLAAGTGVWIQGHGMTITIPAPEL